MTITFINLKKNNNINLLIINYFYKQINKNQN